MTPTEIVLSYDILSCGILCWSKPPGTNDVYFLLGKERKNRKWKQGSNRFSDFGGGAKAGENAFDCATREFVEESLACVQVLPDRYTPLNELAATTKGLLRAGTYTAAIQLFVYPKVPAPIAPANPTTEKTPETNVDKVVNLGENRDWRTAGPIRTPSQFPSPTLVQIGQPCFAPMNPAPKTRVCFLKFIPWQPGCPRYFLKVHRYLQRLYTFAGKAGDEALTQPDHLQKVIQMYEELPYSIRKHPAINIKRNPATNEIASLTVNPDYLEKQLVSWWSLPMIDKVIENNGQYNKFIFRKNFLPFLRIAAQILGGKN
jgi:hypothetical protein